MDLNDVVVFARVVDKGSFTGAADALGVPKSSVSRSVTRLEEDLGVRLLQRTTRRISLTDAGERFFERARPAISGLTEAADDVRELGATPRGRIRMTANPDAFTIGLSQMAAVFLERHPEVQIEMVSTGRVVDLVGEGFDLALRAGKLKDSTLTARKVGAIDWRLFAAPSYLDRRGRPKTIADLANHDCLLFRANGDRLNWTLTGPDGAEHVVAVRGRLNADDPNFLGRAAAAGAGIALLPLPAARGFGDDEVLEPVLHDYRVVGAELSLVLPSSVFVPARVALFRDYLAAEIAKRLSDFESRCQKRKGRR
jgi:DNA-binding transcriptional LysR family regulator